MDKFSELKAAALAATPGPWFRSGVQFNGITTEQSVITQGNKPHVASASEKRDAIFIAEANPAAVLELMAELEGAQQRSERLDAMLTESVQALKAAEQRIAELEQAMRHIHGAALDITVPRTAIAKAAGLAVEYAAGHKVEGEA
ncbi:ead/Ea22-like family protein [Serratia rubidaea]|nr:ead/Ea22-like family protein [Serratia rubidaea]